MRVLEASNTCQQIPTGSDVLDFVMNEFTHDFGGGDTLGLEAMRRKLFRSSETAVAVNIAFSVGVRQLNVVGQLRTAERRRCYVSKRLQSILCFC